MFAKKYIFALYKSMIILNLLIIHFSGQIMQLIQYEKTLYSPVHKICFASNFPAIICRQKANNRNTRKRIAMFKVSNKVTKTRSTSFWLISFSLRTYFKFFSWVFIVDFKQGKWSMKYDKCNMKNVIWKILISIFNF